MKNILEWGKCVVRGFVAHNCPIHAAGLTYFAILATVPVLCCILVTAKMCGVDHYARDRINEHIDSMIANIESGAADDTLAVLAPKDEEEKRKKRIAAEELYGDRIQISSGRYFRI